jgi:putative spermidine/putrescine transport system ATP-binding protein
VADGRAGALGVVEELVYTGPTTRCVVALDDGGQLSVLLLAGPDDKAVPDRGTRVRLSWRTAHEVPLTS